MAEAEFLECAGSRGRHCTCTTGQERIGRCARISRRCSRSVGCSMAQWARSPRRMIVASLRWSVVSCVVRHYVCFLLARFLARRVFVIAVAYPIYQVSVVDPNRCCTGLSRSANIILQDFSMSLHRFRALYSSQATMMKAPRGTVFSVVQMLTLVDCKQCQARTFAYDHVNQELPIRPREVRHQVSRPSTNPADTTRRHQAIQTILQSCCAIPSFRH